MGAHESPAHPDDGTRLILDSLRRIVRALRLFDRQAERVAGLSAAQLFVLQTLRDGDSISINQLAKRTHTDQSSVSVVAQKLVRRGLVRRIRSFADRRRVDVFITNRGKKLLKSAPAAAQERLIAAIGELDAPQRGKLAIGLEQLVHRTGIDARKPSLFFEDGKR